MPIRILPPEVADRIAAGEVVERPASVVKELVENALDAGATYVRVEITEGGRRLIRVSDNGCGIPAAELPLAVRRHATSKITTAEDLAAIYTLGFRGEALAAIASVARLTLTSRYREEHAGARVVVEGGHIVRQETVGHPIGTTVVVEHLFFNTPARRKFLKAPRTEAGHVQRVVTRYALAFPEVRFALVSDGRIAFQSPGTGRLADAVTAVYGADVARELVPLADEEVQPETEDVLSSVPRIWGYTSKPSYTRPNAQSILFFLNKRWITDRALVQAVVQAYHTLLPTGRYPLSVVHIALDPRQVDVNVHPAKAEVRFREPRVVFTAVQRAVRAAVTASSGTPLGPVETTPVSGWTLPASWAERQRSAGSLAPSFPSLSEDTPTQGELIAQKDTSSRATLLPLLRVVGQVGGAYIVAEGPDGLYLIDQHAAHERVLYEKLMAERERAGQLPSQHLLDPIPITVDSDQGSLLAAHREMLHRLGFVIEVFGESTYLVRAVPAVLSGQHPAQVLEDVLEGLRDARDLVGEQLERAIVARICKRAAVKAGQVLSDEEMRSLVRELEACQVPHTCPHGRPTIWHISAADLAKRFGRT